MYSNMFIFIFYNNEVAIWYMSDII